MKTLVFSLSQVASVENFQRGEHVSHCERAKLLGVTPKTLRASRKRGENPPPPYTRKKSGAIPNVKSNVSSASPVLKNHALASMPAFLPADRPLKEAWTDNDNVWKAMLGSKFRVIMTPSSRAR
jgi:hypothetical protein